MCDKLHELSPGVAAGRTLEGVTLRVVTPGADEVMLCTFEGLLMVKVTGICNADSFPGVVCCTALPGVTIRGAINWGV